MNGYSLDMLAKLAFEKEIEHLDYAECSACELGDKERVIEYLKRRVKEIKEQYKDW